jgi:hypothetical protein
MGDVLLKHQIAFPFELFNRGGHIHRVPYDHCISEQMQTARLICLLLFLFAANRALIGKEEKLPQGMQRFTFIELGVDASPLLLILQIAQNEDGLYHPAILLQGHTQGIAARIGLELRDKQGGGHEAQFQ